DEEPILRGFRREIDRHRFVLVPEPSPEVADIGHLIGGPGRRLFGGRCPGRGVLRVQNGRSEGRPRQAEAENTGKESHLVRRQQIVPNWLKRGCFPLRIWMTYCVLVMRRGR